MSSTIDVHDLPDEEVRFVQRFVEFLRNTATRRKVEPRKIENEDEKIEFLSKPLGAIKGTLSRREIYDYL